MNTELTAKERIRLALEDIKAAGLNSFRCYLTGAPYAEIIDQEITFALESELMEHPKASVARLVDMWELKSIAFSNQILPSLRGASSHSLVPHLRNGLNGNARIATYMLTRLFFPHIGTKGLESDARIARASFSRQCHDFMLNEGFSKCAELVQRLTAIDAYCAMPLWHSLWHFQSEHSAFGLDRAPKNVRLAFRDPESIFSSVANIDAVIEFMFRLMLEITDRDGVAGKSGSRMAQRILVLEVEVQKVQGIPLHQKREVSQADLARIEMQKRIAANKHLRVAHSAIHGPKQRPGGGHFDPLAALAKAARETAKKQAKHESKPAQKKTSSISDDIRRAFAAVSPVFVMQKKD